MLICSAPPQKLSLSRLSIIHGLQGGIRDGRFSTALRETSTKGYYSIKHDVCYFHQNMIFKIRNRWHKYRYQERLFYPSLVK